MQKYLSCALTGHRDLPDGFDKENLYYKLEELLGGGCETFFCGMARGFDLLALECLVSLKQRKKFYIEACVPYGGQERSFDAEDRKKYRQLIGWCDRTTVLFPSFRAGCFLARDRYMVDCADALLAYCTRETGGAAYTVKYARKKGIPVLFV